MFGTETTQFPGQLQGEGETTYMPVVIQVDEGRLRMWSGRKRFGSWALLEITAERLTPFRFGLRIEDVTFTFIPDDPGGFSTAVSAIIDLRTHKRFGLAERIRQSTTPQD